MKLSALMSLSDGAARSLAKSAVVEGAKAKLMAAASKSKAVLMSLAFGLSLSSSAFASEGSGGSNVDMASLISSTDNVVTMVNKVWTLMMSNPLLTTYVGAGLLSMGIGFFLYLKKAAHR